MQQVPASTPSQQLPQPHMQQVSTTTQTQKHLQPCLHQLQATTQSTSLNIQPPMQVQLYSATVPTVPVPTVTTGAVYLPSQPKPPYGVFAFARLSFLDKRVSLCYACGQGLKKGRIHLKTW